MFIDKDNGEYKKWWGSVSSHLGGVYPYFDIECPDYFSLDIGEIIERRRQRGAPVVLDKAAVVCKIVKPYLLGDRTLVKGIVRAPWMSNYVASKKKWERVSLPPHTNIQPNPHDFTRKLLAALKAELVTYINKSKSVGILLSGGMDSRVVAGLLRDYQLNIDAQMDVTAITWGDADSRDVIYAKRIAKKYGWNLIHKRLNSKVLKKNIYAAAYAGAEFSGLHLHAMLDVSELKDLDLILAGSYGDSVGRAEFSGKKVTQLTPEVNTLKDRFGLLKKSAISKASPILKSDCLINHVDDSLQKIRKNEIEQEMHYMRRMLQASMFTIAKEIPLFQMFTSQEVFGLMWGLSPEVRDNSWYKLLLQELPGSLLDIPWARTGKLYEEENSEQADSLTKNYHQYGRWLKNDLVDFIKMSVNDDSLSHTGLFNYSSIEELIEVWSASSSNSISSLDEVICWLASLSIFIEHYDLDVGTEYYPSGLSDIFIKKRGVLYARLFLYVRSLFRK